MTSVITLLPGKTVKQLLTEQFYARLGEYKVAIESGTHGEFLAASCAVHAALCALPNPKRFRPLVRRVFRETKRIAPVAA